MTSPLPLRWCVYTMLAAFAVAVIAFPTPQYVPGGVPHTIAGTLQDAQNDWLIQSERLRRAHSRMVAREAVASLGTPDSAARYEFLAPSVFAGEMADAVRLAADRVLAPVRDPSIRVVVAMVLDSGQVLQGVPTYRGRWSSSTDTFIPGAITTNSCVMVVRARVKLPRETALPTIGGASCYWFGKYGVPGRGMASLLDSTGHRAVLFRERRAESTRESYLALAAQSDFRVLKCLADDRSMCERSFLGRPDRRTGIYAGLVTNLWSGVGRSGGNSEYLGGVFLSRLEHELGDREFAALWKSDKDFPAAFADARGVTLADWVHDLLVAELPPRHSGPVPVSPVMFAAALAISGLLGAGLAGASKRSGLV